ncbi:MAG TPA: DUF6069 family protein [Thermomicrobiaceae bacterium]|nr:DUF6069 family protein [Thermomicrobiaceae bacterium]
MARRLEGIAWRRLPPAALLAAAVAAGANALIYLAASGLGLISGTVAVATPAGNQPLAMAPVVISSILGTFAAALVFAVIALIARRPDPLFRVVATVFLVLSLAAPLTIPDAPAAMKVSLVLMHVVAWGVSVALLTTLARRRVEE